jgi:PilZ domain
MTHGKLEIPQEGRKMMEKRSEPRFMCAELVNIRISHEDQTVEEAIANLEDISPSGACVHLDAAVRLGADIEIVCSTCRFKGKVRNCRYAEGAYDVGIAFDTKRAWDASRYVPAHLLPIETGLAHVEQKE